MRMYSDVSHFRAPYQNVSVRGFGAVTNGGEVAVPGSTCPTDPASVNVVSTLGGDGIRRYTPAEADQLLSQLHGWRVIFLTTTEVKIEPITTEEMAAAQADPAYGATLEGMRASKWIADKVAEGFAIYAPFTILCPTEEILTSSIGLRIGATLATDRKQMAAASVWPTPEMPMGAYLVDPAAGGTLAVAKSDVTVALWALGIVAAIGAGAYMVSRSRRGRYAGDLRA